MKMGIEDELKKQGYELEYESTDGHDRKQVWVNEKLGMAVRIEWMRVGAPGNWRPCREPRSRRSRGRCGRSRMGRLGEESAVRRILPSGLRVQVCTPHHRGHLARRVTLRRVRPCRMSLTCLP